MKVIPATEKTKDGINTYDIIIGTGLIFDYKNKKVFYCSDDKDQWSDNSLILDIEGTTVIFYVIETLSYDVVKDMAEVIRIQEIENDLDYMKSHEEHGYSCSGCDFEQSDINNVPCNNCVNYSNYTHEDKNKSYNEIVNDFIPPVNDKECPSWINPTTWNAMNNVQKSINDFFSNLSNPKTLNTKTGCLENMESWTKEKAFDCSECYAEQSDVKVEPCKSCKDYCNYKSNSMLSDCCSAPIRYLDCEDCKKKGVPCPIVICTQCGATIHDHTDEQAAEIQDNVRYDDQHKVIPTDPETLDNTIEYKPTGKLDKEIKCTTMNDICGPLKETFGKYVGPILMNDIHNKSIKHIKFIIDYLWADELKAFQEYTEYVIQSQDDLQSWINVCEKDATEDHALTDCVFYHLMKLKKLYNL